MDDLVAEPVVVRSFPYDRLEVLLKSMDPTDPPESLTHVPEQPLRWRSGDPLSEPAREHFILAILEAGGHEQDTLVRWVRPFLKDLDCYKLCRRLMEAADDDEDVMWPLYIQAVLGSPFQVKRLARHLERAEDSAEPWTALDVVELLRRERSPEAMEWLSHWSQNSKHPRVARACREALEELAAGQNTSVQELLRAELPELYLNADNERRFDYGPRTIVAKMKPDLSFDYRQEGGRSFSVVPPLRKSDDTERATESRTNLKKLVRNTRQCVSRQSELLESAMCHGRRWPVALWRERFLIHPVVRMLSRSLVFVLHLDGEAPQPFMVADGLFLNLAGEPVELPAGSAIGVLHPIQIDPDERDRWKERVVEQSPVEPPFDQFSRPVFEAAEHREAWVNPTATLGEVDVLLLRKARRNTDYRGSVRKGQIASLKRIIGPYRAEIDFDLTYPGEEAVPVKEANCVRVAVFRGDQRLPVSAVPPSVFSEVTWDLLQLSGHEPLD